MDDRILADKLREAHSQYMEERNRKEKERMMELEIIFDEMLQKIEDKMLDINNWDPESLEFIYYMDDRDKNIAIGYVLNKNFMKIQAECVKKLKSLGEKHGVQLGVPYPDSNEIKYEFCSFSCRRS